MAIQLDRVKDEIARLAGEADDVVDGERDAHVCNQTESIHEQLVRHVAPHYLPAELFVAVLEAKGHPMQPDIHELPNAIFLDHYRFRPCLAPEWQPDMPVHLDESVEFLRRVGEKRIRPEEHILDAILLDVVQDLLTHPLRPLFPEKLLGPKELVLRRRVAEPARIRTASVRLDREHPKHLPAHGTVEPMIIKERDVWIGGVLVDVDGRGERIPLNPAVFLLQPEPRERGVVFAALHRPQESRERLLALADDAHIDLRVTQRKSGRKGGEDAPQHRRNSHCFANSPEKRCTEQERAFGRSNRDKVWVKFLDFLPETCEHISLAAPLDRLVRNHEEVLSLDLVRIDHAEIDVVVGRVENAYRYSLILENTRQQCERGRHKTLVPYVGIQQENSHEIFSSMLFWERSCFGKERRQHYRTENKKYQ